jgi:hypothetical protein
MEPEVASSINDTINNDTNNTTKALGSLEGLADAKLLFNFSLFVITFCVLYIYMDMLLNLDDVAVFYPQFNETDSEFWKYCKHFGFMILIWLRVFFTLALILVACWFVLMFLVDMMLPFLKGEQVHTPGTTPEVQQILFSFLPSQGIKQAFIPGAEEVLPASENGWMFMVNLLKGLFVIFVVSLAFMRPSTMTDEKANRAQIRLLVTLMMLHLILTVFVHAILL